MCTGCISSLACAGAVTDGGAGLLAAGGSLKVTDLWNSSGSFVLGAATQGLTAHTAHLDATLWKITGASEPAK